MASQCQVSQGDQINVGNGSYEIEDMYCVGSHGSIFQAHDMLTGQVCVVKEIGIGCGISVREALLEISSLRAVTELVDSTNMIVHIPRYRDHTVTESSVVVVMDKAEGRRLDMWLYDFDSDDFYTLDIDQIQQSGSLSLGGQAGKLSLMTVLDYATSILTQLANTFECFGQLMFHRDCSPRNIIIHEARGHLFINLIDMSTAVDCIAWCGGGWREQLVAGHVRYWSPSSWMTFLFSADYLASRSDDSFLNQYINRLDHFSVGVLSLEVFFNLWNGMDRTRSPEALASLRRARAAWWAYYIYALKVYQTIMAKGGDLEAVRGHLQRIMVVHHIVDRISALEKAIRVCCMHCPDLRPFFSVIVDLISDKGNFDWSRILGMVSNKRPILGSSVGSNVSSHVASGSSALATASLRSPKPMMRTGATIKTKPPADYPLTIETQDARRRLLMQRRQQQIGFQPEPRVRKGRNASFVPLVSESKKSSTRARHSFVPLPTSEETPRKTRSGKCRQSFSFVPCANSAEDYVEGRAELIQNLKESSADLRLKLTPAQRNAARNKLAYRSPIPSGFALSVQ